MAKHKDPSQITIASVQERTVLHELVERYWKFGTGLAMVAIAAILIPRYTMQRSQSASLQNWDRLRSEVEFGSALFGGIQGGSPPALGSFANEFPGKSIGAWAKALEVGAQLQEEKYEEAEKAASQLATTWPDHPLVSAAVIPGPDGNAVKLPEAIRSKRAKLEAWKKEHAFMFSNPALPTDAPRVRLNTSKGPIVIGLYVDRAPKHAENFLELCRQGYYNGTKFHRVVRGSLIQGGDPNSISGEPDTWGLGGPEVTLEPEIDPQLRQFKGTLSAWKAPEDTGSHGSQFFLTTTDQSDMDGQFTVFGSILEGEAVVEAIESGAVVGERPQDPAVIQSTEIL